MNDYEESVRYYFKNMLWEHPLDHYNVVEFIDKDLGVAIISRRDGNLAVGSKILHGEEIKCIEDLIERGNLLNEKRTREVYYNIR